MHGRNFALFVIVICKKNLLFISLFQFLLFLNITDSRKICTVNAYINKKTQLSLTNPLDAWNSGHGSLKGIENDTIR